MQTFQGGGLEPLIYGPAWLTFQGGLGDRFWGVHQHHLALPPGRQVVRAPQGNEKEIEIKMKINRERE